MNQSQKLFEEAGQSVWYDNIQRRLLKDGEMERMISQREIRGVTSNPAIFMNAITRSEEYDETLVPMARAGADAMEIFYQLAIEDIQATADLFQPLYAQTEGGDGYVSLEVSPYLAKETEATLDEARRLWKRVDRPNLMIKIPATVAGLPAITEALAAGINVNVTLIFSRQRYAKVMDAHMAGLGKRLARGLPIDRVASVASFFVSRVDTNIDPRLQAMIDRQDPRAEAASSLLGKAAIANARLAYADFKAVMATRRFKELKARGARPQRPLWASTSTKNPLYRDVIYVEELIGPDTVNTIPPHTLAAFLEHGQVRPGSLEENIVQAQQSLDDLEGLGISMKAVTQQLEEEGVKAFADAFTALLQAVEKRSQAVTDR
jgi:transaldolase